MILIVKDQGRISALREGNNLREHKHSAEWQSKFGALAKPNVTIKATQVLGTRVNSRVHLWTVSAQKGESGLLDPSRLHLKHW